MRLRFIALVAFSLLHAACSDADDGPLEMPQSALSARADVMTGPLSFNVQTDSGLREVRLTMLETPDDERTQSLLADSLDGQQVWLDPVREGPDRYGRTLARVWLGAGDEPALLQAQLVEAGAARVLAYPDNSDAEIAYLLGLETEARRARRGLWSDDTYRIRDTDPDVLAQEAGVMHLVEGRVLDVTELSSGRVYLNFGSDWRTDFTIMIDARDRDAFDTAPYNVLELETHRVRVRGVIRDENGPMIRLDHPMRLEVLGDTDG